MSEIISKHICPACMKEFKADVPVNSMGAFYNLPCCGRKMPFVFAEGPTRTSSILICRFFLMPQEKQKPQYLKPLAVVFDGKDYEVIEMQDRINEWIASSDIIKNRPLFPGGIIDD